MRAGQTDRFGSVAIVLFIMTISCHVDSVYLVLYDAERRSLRLLLFCSVLRQCDLESASTRTQVC